MTVGVFTHALYDSGAFALSLIPDEVRVYYPDLNVDKVVSERMTHLPTFSNVTIEPVRIVMPKADPLLLIKKSFTENSLFKFEITKEMIKDLDTVITKELHTRFSYSLSSITSKLGIKLISLTEMDFNNFIPKIPPYSFFANAVLKRTNLFGSSTPLSDLYLRGLGVNSFERIFFSVVNTEDFIVTKVPEDERDVLFVGRLEKYKGFGTFIKALNLLSKKYEFKAHIVGDGSQRVLLNDARFKFEHYPFIPKEDLKMLYEKCSLLVVPSESQFLLGKLYWSEVFSVATLEAMASGRPVVTSDSGNLPYINQSSDAVFKQGDPEDLSKRISFFFDNLDIAVKTGLNNGKFVESIFNSNVIRSKWKRMLSS